MKGEKRKVAVVTGADGGIGMEFCRQLGHQGHDLFMVSNRKEALERAAEEVSHETGMKTYTLELDLTKETAARDLLAHLDSMDMEADVLINNAGIFSFCPVGETAEGKLSCFIDLHVRAVTDLTRLVAERMKERGSGHILNMSSMSCWMPMPGIAMYSATKAYIRVLSRAMHYEYRDSGVRIMTAAPGGIATDLFGLPDNLKRLALRLGAIVTPQKFVRKALKRLFAGKQQYINGFTNRLAIVFIGTAPTWLRMQVKRQLLDRGIRH